jgi:predicted phage terminase large subunit-like protein
MPVQATMLSHSQQMQAERAKRSFSVFALEAWSVIEPGTQLQWTWHLDAIAEHLQALYERQITRLLINIAPGHAKSSFISVLFPDWVALNDPASRWLCASHSLDLAIRDNKNRRDLIEHEWFQQRYGHLFQLSSSQNVKSFYENNHKGYSMAVGVRASGTGKRASHMLIDDPHNAMEGEADRKAVIAWFGKTWMSRLNDQEHGPMVVVGQRLHQQDLSGHILELGGWEHLNLPEEYEPSRKCFTSIGWSDPRKEEGELLWPDRFTAPILARLKHSLGSMDYAAQYQQTPVPSGGGQFRKEWLRYATETPQAWLLETANGPKSILKSSCRAFATVDLAISSKQSADFTVIAFWATTPEKDLILFDMVRGRFDNPTQMQQIEILNQKYRPEYVQIETVGYQLALVQQLLQRGVPCKEYKPVRDKVSRAVTAAIWFENGKVFLLKHLALLTEIEQELLLFPKAAHDDIVDNFSMAAEVVVSRRTPGVLDLDDDNSELMAEAIRQEQEQLKVLNGQVSVFAWAADHSEGEGW